MVFVVLVLECVVMYQLLYYLLHIKAYTIRSQSDKRHKKQKRTQNDIDISDLYIKHVLRAFVQPMSLTDIKKRKFWAPDNVEKIFDPLGFSVH